MHAKRAFCAQEFIMSRLKKSAGALFFCFAAALLCAQEADSDEENYFSSFFDNAEDIEIDEHAPPSEPPSSTEIRIGDFVVPLNFSDHLDTEVGGGYMWNDRNSSNELEDGFFGYLRFDNYLYMTARASGNLSFRGSIQTKFPDWTLRIYELYFDYLAFDRLYITAGKKANSWGYVRLFSDGDNYAIDDDDEEGTFYIPGVQTDILHDSRNSSSILVRVPVLTGMVSGIAMLPDESSSTDPALTDMSYAASAEITFLKTSINIFGRKYPTTVKGEKIPDADRLHPLLGIEAKRTILGVDVYTQGLVRISDFSLAKRPFAAVLKHGRHPENDDYKGYDTFVATSGFYKWWNSGAPNGGLNAEYQTIYTPSRAYDKRFRNRMAFAGTIGKLGPSNNIRLALEWNHDFTFKSGNVTPGVILTGIFPHAQWRNAVKIEYGGDYEGPPRVSLGSTLSISIDF